VVGGEVGTGVCVVAVVGAAVGVINELGSVVGVVDGTGIAGAVGGIVKLDGAVGPTGTVVGVVGEMVETVDVLDSAVGAVGPTGTVVGVLGAVVGLVDILGSVVGVLAVLGTTVGPPGNVGAVTAENVILSSAGPIATHDVFTVYVPATFDVNDTLNVVSLTFVIGPTTTSDVGLPLASNTRTSNWSAEYDGTHEVSDEPNQYVAVHA